MTRSPSPIPQRSIERNLPNQVKKQKVVVTTCLNHRIALDILLRLGKCGQLPTPEVVGLPVGLPGVAPLTRKPHASDCLLRGVLRWLSGGESEGLDQHPLSPGLADGQPVPPTASGPVGRIYVFRSESHQSYALPPTAESETLPRCFRCNTNRVGDVAFRQWTMGLVEIEE